MKSHPRRAVLVLTFLVIMWGVTGAGAQGAKVFAGANQITDYQPGEVLIGYHPGAGTTVVDSVHQKMKARVVRDFSEIDVQLVQLPANLSVEEAIAQYEQDPRVAYAEPNYRGYVDAVPNDPDYPTQWAWPVIQAPEAWDIHTGNGTVVVGCSTSATLGIGVRER